MIPLSSDGALQSMDRSNLVGMQLRELSVVVAIPTLNEERNIVSVIQSLVSEKVSLPDLHVVVADGGSRDRTVALVEELQATIPFLTVVRNPKKLQSAAVNMVADQWRNRANILVRCDAHAHYPDGFVLGLLTTLMKVGADSVVVPMDSSGRDCVEKAVAWISDTPFGSGGSAHRGGKHSGFVDHGHHAAFRLSSFLANGGYDETFSHNEDAEFDCRLNARGGKVFLDSDIRLVYHPRNSFSRLSVQYFNYGKGRSRTMRRHPQTIRLRQAVVPTHFVLCLLSIWAALLTVSFRLLAWPILYGLVLAMLSVALAIKKRSICGLLGGPAAAVMHFSWAAGFFWGLLTVTERRWKPESNVVR